MTEANEVAYIVMRVPKGTKERMYAALMSRDEDIFEHNGRYIIWGKNKEGEDILLGDVDASAIYQKGVSPMGLIERVRFGK